MVGWFKKPIRALADIQGLKIRMAGLQSEVLSRLGATTINLPGGEVMPALQSGVIDAAEWGGPWMDLPSASTRSQNIATARASTSRARRCR